MGKIIIFFLIPFIIFGQSSYEEWLKKENARYQNFISEEDKRFAEFLEKDWEKFQLSQGMVFDKSPKVKVMPVFKEKKDTIISKIIKTDIQEERELTDTVSEIEHIYFEHEETVRQDTGDSSIKSNEEVVTSTFDGNPLEEEKDIPPKSLLDFYGFKMRFTIPNDISVKLNSVDNKSIAEFWKKMSAKEFRTILDEVQNSKEELALNDWGYIQLLNQIGYKIYGTENYTRNERYLFIWFMLVKSHYKAKVGIIDNQVYLLLNSKNIIFRTLFFTTGNDEKQYVINLDNLRFHTQLPLYTFDEDFPDADKLIKMDITKPMTFDNNIMEKELSFIWKEVEYIVPVKYSKTVVNLFAEYPYSNLDIYFNSEKTSIVKESLLRELNEIIKGKSKTEAANILLRFSQEAFKYKTDPEQFGYEKPLFVEETLFYPYSDCEDRSIMFAFLVRSLLGLDVLAVDYPGHVATAVDFGEQNRGDKVTYKGREFTVCDPTYMGAKIGNAQPRYVNSKIENVFFVK